MSYASKLMDSANKNSFPAKAEAKATETEVEAKAETKETSVEESPAPEAELEAEAAEEDLESIKKRTAESLEDEVKKLRQENAKRREREKKAHEEAAKLFSSEREQYETQMAEMKKQLEGLSKVKEAKAESEIDNSIEVKAKESELSAIREANAALKKQLDAISAAQKAQEEKESEEKKLRSQAIQSRFDEELKSIPEDKQKFAKSMFKGHEDAQEGLFAFLEAKREGLFGKKQIQVIHKPTNTQSTEKQQSNNQEKITSKQKIRSGLSKSLSGGLQPGQNLRINK